MQLPMLSGPWECTKFGVALLRYCTPHGKKMLACKPPVCLTVEDCAVQEHGAHLHEHQVEAVNSLRQRWGQGESLLLADDSGLGKSTSFIVFVHSLR